MPTEDLNKLVSAGLMAVGIIRYYDIFGEPHLTEFFTPIDGDNFPIGQPLRIRGNQCPTHNCEDDECSADWKDRAIGKIR
jgi:hypothetical protein